MTATATLPVDTVAHYPCHNGNNIVQAWNAKKQAWYDESDHGDDEQGAIDDAEKYVKLDGIPRRVLFTRTVMRIRQGR